MTRERFQKIFYDKEKLCIMLNLRINGWAHSSLAILYGIDISSIRHQCDKYEVMPLEVVYTIERIGNDALSKMPLRKEPEWEEWEGKKYAVGKTYAEYLKDAGYPPNKKW